MLTTCCPWLVNRGGGFTTIACHGFERGEALALVRSRRLARGVILGHRRAKVDLLWRGHLLLLMLAHSRDRRGFIRVQVSPGHSLLAFANQEVLGVLGTLLTFPEGEPVAIPAYLVACALLTSLDAHRVARIRQL